MAQAMLRLFATPRTTPVLPERMPSLITHQKGHPENQLSRRKSLSGFSGSKCPTGNAAGLSESAVAFDAFFPELLRPE
jgi:hypothetical protein